MRLLRVSRTNFLMPQPVLSFDPVLVMTGGGT
jgi:hypothetical protein